MGGRHSTPQLPPDQQLPAATTLFDVDAVVLPLSELFNADVSDVRIRYIDYEPGGALTVQYDARSAAVTSLRVEAFACTQGDGWDLHAYPHDLALPLLSADGRQLAEVLEIESGDCQVTRLAWVPQRRAVLRCGQIVVKLYGDPTELSCAEGALRAVGGALRTAALITSRPDLGAVVQQALGGRTLGRDDVIGSASGAAAVLRQLHSSTLGDLADLRPAQLLAAANRPAALAAFALPHLAERILALVQRLGATMPEAADVVPVHGDFNVGQLLVDGDDAWVIDVDTLAQGSPSVDLAAYAANVHNGRPADGDDMNVALATLIDAYGQAPDDLMWHLATTMLRRVDRPIRRMKKRWPERTTSIVSAIEVMLNQ